MTLAFWICGIITAISALVSLGYAISALRGTVAEARTASKYAFARSLALAIVAVIAPFTGAVPFLVAITVAVILVQAVDAVVGASIRDRFKTVGPAATAVANLAALSWLLLS